MLQAIAWVLYVGIVLTLFLRPARPAAPAAPAQRAPSATPTSGARPTVAA